MENTTEKNRLICKFMGGELFKPDNTNYEIVQFPKDIFYSFRSGSSDPNLPFSVPISYARFNISWNWLMPVVEKINIIDDFRYTVLINSMDCRIIDSRNLANSVADSFGRFNPDELLQAIYTAVVQFIQFYNLQSK